MTRSFFTFRRFSDSDVVGGKRGRCGVWGVHDGLVVGGNISIMFYDRVEKKSYGRVHVS